MNAHNFASSAASLAVRIMAAAGAALAPIDASFAAPPEPASNAQLSARDLMEKNFFVSKIRLMTSSATMSLINDKGQTRERRNTTYSQLQPNGVDSKVLVKFTAPADVKGTAFLQVQHMQADDDEWIFLPALGKSRRLVANNKKDSFVGSDFSYGDISLPSVDLFTHRLTGSGPVNGEDCLVVESTPKSDQTKSDLGYSRKVTWLRVSNLLEAKIEYYDLSGRLWKTQLVTNPKLLEPDTGHWIALRREMLNQQTGHKTVLTFENVSVSAPVSEELFTTRYLERE
jgi:hypothetical protein